MDYTTKSKYVYLAEHYLQFELTDKVIRDELSSNELKVLQDLEEDYLYNQLSTLKQEDKASQNSVEAPHSHVNHNHDNDINPGIEKAQNALETESRDRVQLSETTLYNGIKDLEGNMSILVLQAIQQKDFNRAEELLTKAQKNSLISQLTTLLKAYFLIVYPVYGNQLMQNRASEFGEQGVWTLTREIEEAINEAARKGAISHIDTVEKDLYSAIRNELDSQSETKFIELIKQRVDAREEKYLRKLPNNPNLEDIRKAVQSGKFTDDPMYKTARDLARQGEGLDAITSAVKKKYEQISRNRARTIARHETNRVFNMAQYQADLQFLTETGRLDVAYKRMYNRANDPCPVCAKIIDETNANPIPFEQNFASIGDELSATYTKENGKVAVQTIPVSYEDIVAGNVHVNCRCEYELVIKQEDGTFLNALTNKVENYAPGQARDKKGRFASSNSSYSAALATIVDGYDLPTAQRGRVYQDVKSQLGIADDKPQTVEAYSKGATTLYRGTNNKDPLSETSWKEFESADGDNFTETNSGMYLSADKLYASSYGTVYEFGLKSNAKILNKNDDFGKSYQKVIDDAAKKYSDDFNSQVKLTSMLTNDQGLVALLGGYDGYIRSGINIESATEVVIVNKAALEQLSVKSQNYAPSQARDKAGRWTDGGAYSTLGPNAYIERIRADFTGNFTSKEKLGIIDYTGERHDEINEALRSAGGDLKKVNSYYREKIEGLDTAMKHELKEDTLLFRGLELDGRFEAGDTISNKGFSSSSFSRDTAEGFAYNAVIMGKPSNAKIITIRAKKGQKGLVAATLSDNDADISLRSQEKEFLLPRNLNLEVISTRRKTGKAEGKTFRYTEVITEVK